MYLVIIGFFFTFRRFFARWVKMMPRHNPEVDSTKLSWVPMKQIDLYLIFPPIKPFLSLFIYRSQINLPPLQWFPTAMSWFNCACHEPLPDVLQVFKKNFSKGHNSLSIPLISRVSTNWISTLEPISTNILNLKCFNPLILYNASWWRTYPVQSPYSHLFHDWILRPSRLSGNEEVVRIAFAFHSPPVLPSVIFSTYWLRLSA